MVRILELDDDPEDTEVEIFLLDEETAAESEPASAMATKTRMADNLSKLLSRKMEGYMQYFTHTAISRNKPYE